MIISIDNTVVIITAIIGLDILAVYGIVKLWDMYEFNKAAKAYIASINNEPMIRYKEVERIVTEEKYKAAGTGLMCGVVLLGILMAGYVVYKNKKIGNKLHN